MDKKLKRIGAIFCIWICTVSCEEDVRNIAGDQVVTPSPSNPYSSSVNPIDINVDGFDFLENMQGDWIGMNRVIADEWDWFAFDYRPISPSHIHGIFEGGSGGNLLTSFFVTDFQDTRTIMARNGGLLNGIYRTSYFVMDSVSSSSLGKYYRLVDAVGGAATMFMELRFVNDSLYFNAYTSRLGVNLLPTRHMTFKASKQYPELAETAASVVGFPENTPAWDFSQGFDTNFLYINPGETSAKSASFLAADDQKDVFTLAQESGDPFTISDHPYLGYLQVDIERNSTIADDPWFLYLSQAPLTDEFGFLTDNQEAYNTVLKFSNILESQDSFTFTYLHPGEYYVNIIMDSNQDGFISEGDISAQSVPVTITPEDAQQITIVNIENQN